MSPCHICQRRVTSVIYTRGLHWYSCPGLDVSFRKYAAWITLGSCIIFTICIRRVTLSPLESLHCILHRGITSQISWSKLHSLLPKKASLPVLTESRYILSAGFRGGHSTPRLSATSMPHLHPSCPYSLMMRHKLCLGDVFTLCGSSPVWSPPPHTHPTHPPPSNYLGLGGLHITRSQLHAKQAALSHNFNDKLCSHRG